MSTTNTPEQLRLFECGKCGYSSEQPLATQMWHPCPTRKQGDRRLVEMQQVAAARARSAVGATATRADAA